MAADEAHQGMPHEQTQASHAQNTSASNHLAVVGIGASAGGIRALQAFFQAIPPNPGFVFVVVMHLAPERESALPQVLQTYTDMPVRQGLSLCRSVIEGHGGSIRLSSQVGHGTTIYITLPVAPSDVQPAQTPGEADAPEPTRRGRILLIDDEPTVRRALRRLLQRSGHDITVAANGHEGLAAIQEGSYDVILCDIRMPDLDGPGLYRELERCYPHLLSRIIFLTGDVLSPEIQTFFDQVNCPRLVKPFQAQEVRRCIRQVLEAQ